MTEEIMAMAEKESVLILELNKAGRWDEAFAHEQQVRRLLNFLRMERFR